MILADRVLPSEKWVHLPGHTRKNHQLIAMIGTLPHQPMSEREDRRNDEAITNKINRHSEHLPDVNSDLGS